MQDDLALHGVNGRRGVNPSMIAWPACRLRAKQDGREHNKFTCPYPRHQYV